MPQKDELVLNASVKRLIKLLRYEGSKLNLVRSLVAAYKKGYHAGLADGLFLSRNFEFKEDPLKSGKKSGYRLSPGSKTYVGSFTSSTLNIPNVRTRGSNGSTRKRNSSGLPADTLP